MSCPAGSYSSAPAHQEKCGHVMLPQLTRTSDDAFNACPSVTSAARIINLHVKASRRAWPHRRQLKLPPLYCRQEKYGQIVLPQLTGIPDGQVSEELCASAAAMANNLGASAIFVYTRRGYMANFLSRCRPDCPIFAFTGQFHLVCCLLVVSECIVAFTAPPGLLLVCRLVPVSSCISNRQSMITQSWLSDIWRACFEQSSSAMVRALYECQTAPSTLPQATLLVACCSQVVADQTSAGLLSLVRSELHC